jgi:hypothetical protein
MAKTTVKDLKFDNRNANKHSEYGMQRLEKSIGKIGLGRSILISDDNEIIAGNGVTESAINAGIDKVRIIETDGTEIIAVKRTDIKSGSKEFYEMALSDNIIAKENIVMDVEVTNAICEEYELEEYQFQTLGINDSDEFGTDFSLPDGDKAPFQQMTFTLADEQATQIKNAIADIKQTDEYKYAETMGNENSNGNALYLIIMQWAEQRK